MATTKGKLLLVFLLGFLANTGLRTIHDSTWNHLRYGGCNEVEKGPERDQCTDGYLRYLYLFLRYPVKGPAGWELQ